MGGRKETIGRMEEVKKYTEVLKEERNPMKKYSTYISKDLADELISIGCPIRKEIFRSPIGGTHKNAENADLDGYEERANYILPTYEEVLNWIESEFHQWLIPILPHVRLKSRLAFYDSQIRKFIKEIKDGYKTEGEPLV